MARILAWPQAFVLGGMDQVQAVRQAGINGAPGLILDLREGLETISIEADADGRIASIYMVRNLDKLAYQATT